MKIRVLPWHEADPSELRQLYMDYAFPTYWGSAIVDDRLQDYRFRKVAGAADEDPGGTFVAEVDGSIQGAARIARVDHLSDHFGIEVGSIENEAFGAYHPAEAYRMALELIRTLKQRAAERACLFVSVSASSMAGPWLRALEESGFRYADGFVRMVADSRDSYDAFIRPDVIIRDPVPSDFDDIAASYELVPFVNHWLHEPEFARTRMLQLYVKRYREVHERSQGRVLIGEIEGRFAGALILLVDEDIKKETGITVNPLSMGIIVHPRAARRGVSLSLVAHRHNLYRELGMRYGYFGANINSRPMIRGLQKMGMSYAGIDFGLILRLGERG